MSNINRRNNLYLISNKKTFFQNNSKNFRYQNTLSPSSYKEISLKLENNITSRINRIKFDFNNYINKTLLELEHRDINQKHKKRITYNKKKKMRYQRSLENLPVKKMKMKEKEKKDKTEVIKHNYSLKVIKPNLNKKYNFFRVKSIDINLNTENVTPKGFSLIVKNKRKNIKKTANSVNIKKRKTEFINKSKVMKNEFNSFNLDNLENNKENKLKSKTRRNTNFNNLENKVLLSNDKINYSKKRESNTVFKKVKDLKLNNNKNKYKLNKKIERRKLSFDSMNNIIEKNINIEIMGKFYTKTYKSNEQVKLLKPEKESSKCNKEKEDKNNEDNYNYNLLTETEHGNNEGINQIKINNYIINKPKEENMKFSSIKFKDNEEKTENASEISKIIIGQIEGYKDIMDLDKSKSLMELLSKVSFSYTNNNNLNKQSIEKVENINSNFFGDIINNKEINNINITNIKNVDEDYDSEDLSNIIRNNIKSINNRSKEYIYKRKIKFNYRNNIKTSMNTNNTTISSRDKNTNQNNKKNEDEEKNVKKNRINSNILNDFQPVKIKTRSDKNNIRDKKEKVKQLNYDNNKNTLKIMNKKEIKRNLDIKKHLKTIKSTSNLNKKIDTNSIFNSSHKNKKIIKQKIIDDTNYPLNKFPIKNINQNEIINNKENEFNEKVDNNSITTIMNGDNETIVNPCFNDVENEICKNCDQYNDKNKNVFDQCILF